MYIKERERERDTLSFLFLFPSESKCGLPGKKKPPGRNLFCGHRRNHNDRGARTNISHFLLVKVHMKTKKFKKKKKKTDQSSFFLLLLLLLLLFCFFLFPSIFILLDFSAAFDLISVWVSVPTFAVSTGRKWLIIKSFYSNNFC